MKGDVGERQFSLRDAVPVVWLETASAAGACVTQWATAFPEATAIAQWGGRQVFGNKCTMQRQPEKPRAEMRWLVPVKQ